MILYLLYDYFVLAEVFGCVLSLFVGAEDQPLPTDEEVITCDETTTAEEVFFIFCAGLLFIPFNYCR